MDWHDPSVDWSGFEAAFIRSTWDYHRRPDEFLEWVHSTATRTLLVNPAEVVEWNLDKRYLRELAESGLPVLETEFAESLDDLHRVRFTGDVVVKPAISAGANDTGRFVESPVTAREHAMQILSSGRAALVQPYDQRIDDEGETGVVCAGGEPSHGFRKAAILGASGAAYNGLYVEEEITPRVPSLAEERLATRTLEWLDERFGFVPTYARVDMVGGVAGEPRIMEVELVEPSLFLHVEELAARRVALAFIASIAE